MENPHRYLDGDFYFIDDHGENYLVGIGREKKNISFTTRQKRSLSQNGLTSRKELFGTIFM